MKSLGNYIKEHSYRCLFIVSTIIVIGYWFHSYYQYNNIETNQYEPITYEEFEQTIKETREERNGFVSLDFIGSEENINGEVKYNYKINIINNSIDLISGNSLYLDENTFNEYISSNKKLDIVKNRTYEAKLIVTAIEYPSLYKEIPRKSVITPDATDTIPISSFKEIDINKKILVKGYGNITIPKFDKNNKINYNFIEKNLKQEKYEEYTENLKKINSKITKSEQSLITGNVLLSIGVYLIIAVALFYFYCFDLREKGS